MNVIRLICGIICIFAMTACTDKTVVKQMSAVGAVEAVEDRASNLVVAETNKFLRAKQLNEAETTGNLESLLDATGIETLDTGFSLMQILGGSTLPEPLHPSYEGREPSVPRGRQRKDGAVSPTINEIKKTTSLAFDVVLKENLKKLQSSRDLEEQQAICTRLAELVEKKDVLRVSLASEVDKKSIAKICKATTVALARKAKREMEQAKARRLTGLRMEKQKALNDCYSGNSGVLRCNDGSTSNCSCTKRRGCCSHHKGVARCECPEVDRIQQQIKDVAEGKELGVCKGETVQYGDDGIATGIKTGVSKCEITVVQNGIPRITIETCEWMQKIDPNHICPNGKDKMPTTQPAVNTERKR